MGGDLLQRGGPHVRAGDHVGHQLVQLLRPRRPAGQERVVGEHPAATHRPQPLELALPELAGLARGLDQPGAGDVRQVAVLLPVIEGPLDRDLDDRRPGPGRHRQLVRRVRVHQARVVEEAPLGQQGGAAPRQVPHRRAVADRTDAGDLLQGREAAVEVVGLLLRADTGRLLVQVAVVGDLVPGRDDVTDDGRVTVGGVAGDEEGGPDPVPLEQAEQPWHPDQRAVGLVADHAHPVGVLRAAPQHRRLAVDVEGERRGRALPLRPGHRPRGSGHRLTCPAMIVSSS